MAQDVCVQTDHGSIKASFIEAQLSNQIIYEATVQKDDSRTCTSQFVLPLPSSRPYAHIYPDSARIWRFYQQAHAGNFVNRSGFGACEVYGDDYQLGAPIDPHRIESTTEHASGCVAVLESLQWFYPQLLNNSGFERAKKLLRYHDLGENTYGDHMDDGSQNVDEKDWVELCSFASSIASLPAADREELIRDFIYFQNPTDSHIIRNIDLWQYVQLARVIDKLEAILSATFYESMGASGSLEYKDKHHGLLTERDRQSIRDTDGDTSIVATWLAPVLKQYHTFYGFPYVFDIVRAAVCDIRGAWFPWFEKFCDQYRIPPEHIIHPYLVDTQQSFPESFYATPPPVTN